MKEDEGKAARGVVSVNWELMKRQKMGRGGGNKEGEQADIAKGQEGVQGRECGLSGSSLRFGYVKTALIVGYVQLKW